MKLAARPLAAGATLACAALLLPGVALVASALSSTPAAAATVAKCTAASTRVWAAVEGVGTAGTTYYELELSNVGTKTCTLARLGEGVGCRHRRRADRQARVHQGPRRRSRSLRVRPHMSSSVAENTAAICGSQGVTAAGLRVVPPGQSLPSPAGEADEIEHFSLQVCPNQSSMHVLPVHSGTWIPNYTFS